MATGGSSSSSSGNDEDWAAIVQKDMQQQTEEQTKIAQNLCYYAQNGKEKDLQNVATSQNCNHRCGEYGDTALMYAAKSDSSNAPDAVRLLLLLGANVNLRNTDGETALNHAAWAGNAEIVQILLNAGADPNCARSNGATPLIVATASSKEPPAAAVAAIVKNLLQKGADPFARRDDGSNALSWARRRNYDEAASVLLTAMNRTDWKSVARNEMQQQTEEQNAVAQQLHTHANNGNIEKLKKQVTTQNCDCRHYSIARTLLMTAAMSDSSSATEIVDFLLQLGASLEKRNLNGLTVLHYAAGAGNADVVSVLLAQKARFLIEAQDNMGHTALIMATASNKNPPAAAVAAVVEALLQEGADPFARRDDGNDALYWAEKRDFIDVAHLLRSVKTRVNASFNSWRFIFEADGKKKPIGSGGFGKVYKAYTDQNEFIAVKVVEPVGVNPAARRAAYEQEKKGIELLREIQHPAILQFLKTESDDTNNRFYIFTELLSGMTIRKIIDQQQNGIDENGIRKFLLQICSGVSHLHNQRIPILHRDIKSSNIMVTNTVSIKLIGFDFAREMASCRSLVTQEMCGTMHFLAPEIIASEDNYPVYSKKSDVWAIGCTVFEMATMQPPNFQIKNLFLLPKTIGKKPMPQLPANGFSDQLCDFYNFCVIKDKDDRPDVQTLLDQQPFLRM